MSNHRGKNNRTMFPNGSGFKRPIHLSQTLCLSRLYSLTKSLSLWNYMNIWQAYLPVFTNQPHVEFKVFFTRLFLIAWIDSWINMYCLWDFVVIYERSSAEPGNYICCYRKMSCSGYKKIKFLRKYLSYLIFKVVSGMRRENYYGSSFAI